MKKIILLLLLQFSALIFAQAGSLDPTFNPGTGVSGASSGNTYAYVNCTALQSDGKIIIGGGFTSYNSTAINRIARLNSDGSLDTGFNPGTGANSFVSAVAVQPDGKIIIGGDFTTFNNISINRIVRLNTDGSIDTSFNPGLGANNEIKTISFMPNGKIIIGGAFTNYDVTATRFIACLNADGSLDAGFNANPNPYTGFNSTVYTTKILSDGKIIAGGSFSSYSNKPATGVARLNPDGSLDPGFNVSLVMQAPAMTVSIQSDGKIIVGAGFPGQKYLARLNADGSLDTGFKFGGATNLVFATLVQPDGKIIIGGLFKSYAGVYRDDIARLNTDGTVDTSFDPGTGTSSTVNGTGIRSLSLQPDGRIIIGGDFKTYNNISRNGIARLYGDAFPPPSPPQSFCSGATVASLVATGINLKWYQTPSGGSPLAPTATLVNGTYYVSQTVGGIESDRTTVPLTIKTPVIPTFTQVSPICAGTPLQALSPASNNSITGAWSPALDNTKTTIYTFTPAVQYCATTANMTVEVNPLPDLDADYSKIICSGSDEAVQFNAGLLSGSQLDYSYNWSKDTSLMKSEQGYELTVKTAGVYTCVVKNNETGCQNTRTCTLVYSEPIEIKDVIVADLNSHSTVTVVSSDPENSQYSLDYPAGAFQDSEVFENVEPGIHDVYVRDKNGCGVSKTIAVVGAPPFFTPNGDGINDKWKLQGIDDTFYKNSRVEIFDRYGKLIKVLVNADSEGWDGTYNGYPQLADDYWFIINLDDGRVAKGHFALKR